MSTYLFLMQFNAMQMMMRFCQYIHRLCYEIIKLVLSLLIFSFPF